MNSNICIEIKSVTKKYDDKILFQNLSFSLNSGECLGITGANGSGKSTLLKIIAGLIQPSSGHVAIKHAGLALDSEQRWPYIGMVSPEMQIYEALSGNENIMFFTGARGLKTTPAEADWFCNQTGLGQKAEEFVHMYSTGMKQRLKLALLLSVNAPIWLLDEPSSHIDPEGKQVVLKLITDAMRQGKSIVLASNDEAEIGYAHRTITLS